MASDAMKLGFTGSRERPSEIQIAWLRTVFEQVEIEEADHGACIGSDLEFHRMCLEFGVPVVVHPPVKTRFLAVECIQPHPLVTVLPARPYLVRDRQIVVRTQGLVALPKNHEPQINTEWIGGTWYTIQYAQMRYNRAVIICYPDGEIEKREARLVR